MTAVVTRPPLPPSVQAYAPDLSRRFRMSFDGLLTALGRHARKPLLLAIGALLWRRINRIARRFERLLAALAAGRLPRTRAGRPHSGGSPRPENLRLARALPTANGWLVGATGYEVAGRAEQLERLLREPLAAELLALVPEAERILRPLRRMLGMAPFHPNDPNRRRRRPAPAPVAAAAPPPAPPPPADLWVERPFLTPTGVTWRRVLSRPLTIIRHNIV